MQELSIKQLEKLAGGATPDVRSIWGILFTCYYQQYTYLLDFYGRSSKKGAF